MSVKPERIHTLRSGSGTGYGGPVVYWINRDRRAHDNWALLYAQELAQKTSTHVHVVFCLVPSFLQATIRQYDFMLTGLEELERQLRTFNIPFTLLSGAAPDVLPSWLNDQKVHSVVTDFEPLRIKSVWISEVVQKTTQDFYIVDAHNIVPCWHASPKQETGAYTLRPKLRKLLPEFLEEFTPLKKQNYDSTICQPTQWDMVRDSLKVDMSVSPVDWLRAGETSARNTLQIFIEHIVTYAADRNNPVLDAQSNLSPFLHFGHLSAQRIALEVSAIKTPSNTESVDSFLEEMIVRRELSDNFTYYNPSYDSFDGFAAWAQQSLNEHRADKRDYHYTIDQWESASTHDELWNASQMQMVSTGKMHGYMRMYWAKKILEWSSTPEEAIELAIYLNDKYELDGRDPNGYTGIAWSIGGIHDRAWFERPVYGKIRYMNANGCARKFDVRAYINQHLRQGLFS